VVGLGGSAIHSVGAVPSKSTNAYSLTPIFLGVLMKELEELSKNRAAIEFAHKWIATYGEKEIAIAVYGLHRNMQGVSVPVEFLAKTMLYMPDRRVREGSPETLSVLLATPLYVAAADQAFSSATGS